MEDRNKGKGGGKGGDKGRAAKAPGYSEPITQINFQVTSGHFLLPESLEPYQALEFLFEHLARYGRRGIIHGREEQRSAVIPFQKVSERRCSALRFKDYAFIDGIHGTKLIAFGRYAGGSGTSRIISIQWSSAYPETSLFVRSEIESLVGEYEQRVLLAANDASLYVPKNSVYWDVFGKKVEQWAALQHDELMSGEETGNTPSFSQTACIELVRHIITA